MNRERMKDILDRVLSWPAERQEDAADILIAMEASDSSEIGLSDAQADEVRRRLADVDAETISLEEFTAHFKRRLNP
ncbi:hypothetical protein D4Q52_05760 [Rhodopseudomonas palustris]|uniref:Uncharacterized protein n=2 Tax=Rhodopseudomonas palustris TaxID=1076 RepID=A0A418VKH5_RHOPL|nr:hypothetical protein D4Q52_05760 [Rhodopseudomonas palustris]